MPALYVYVFVISMVGTLFIPAGEGIDTTLSLTGIASLFGMSNVYLLFSSGQYFASSVAFNIFTHTWSLAVEEHYYLFFPFVSYLLIMNAGAEENSRLRRVTLASVYFACAASLVACYYFTIHWNPFAFYLLPCRFWELGLGFLLRWQWVQKTDDRLPAVSRVWITVVSIVCFSCMIVSILHTNAQRFPFPGAILPCAATAVILVLLWKFPDHGLDRLLSVAPLVYVGDTSYSLYLWHWGVIALMRWTVGLDTLKLQLIALVIIFALATASYTLVERPAREWLRHRSVPATWFFTSVAALTCILATTVGAMRYFKPHIGLAASNDASIWNPYKPEKTVSGDCGVKRADRNIGQGSVISLKSECSPGQSRRLFVLGDSHAGAYYRMLYLLATRDGYDIDLYSLGGCHPINLGQAPVTAACRNFLRRVDADLYAHIKPGDVVFLPALYTLKYRDTWGDQENAVDLPTYSEDAVKEGRSYVEHLLEMGSKVILEAPKPLEKTAAFRCADWFNRGSSYCAIGSSIPRPEMEFRRGPALDALQAIAVGFNNVSLWDPLPLLCTGKACSAYMDGKPLYFDTDHLTGYGNSVLYPSFREEIGTTLGQ